MCLNSYVCILQTLGGIPINNKKGLGLSFSILSCEVGIMAKIVAKSQIDNVCVCVYNIILNWTCDTTLERFLIRLRFFL
jgi:hypothetical protein